MGGSDFESEKESGEGISCRMCGSDELASVKKLPKMSWMLCKKCLYLHRHPLLTDYDEIFVGSERYDYGAKSEEEFLTEVGQAGQSWEYFPKRVELSPGFKVLDFGSGPGFTLEYLKSVGIEANGIEPSKSTSTYSVAKGHNVLNGYLDQQSFTESHFDVVYIRETAHLVPNISEIFRIFHKILKENGFIFWTGRQLHWSAYNIDGHLTDGIIAAIFSTVSIRNLCSLAGFRVLSYENRFGRYRLVARRTTEQQPLTGSYLAELAWLKMVPINDIVMPPMKSAAFKARSVSRYLRSLVRR